MSTREQFRYEPTENVYYCPEGKPLRLRGVQRASQGYAYQARETDCRECPEETLHQFCTHHTPTGVPLNVPSQDSTVCPVVPLSTNHPGCWPAWNERSADRARVNPVTTSPLDAVGVVRPTSANPAVCGICQCTVQGNGWSTLPELTFVRPKVML